LERAEWDTGGFPPPDRRHISPHKGDVAMLKRERGEGKIGLIIFLALVGVIVFALVKIIPPKVNAGHMEDFCDELAVKWAMDPGYHRFSSKQIVQEIKRKAEELDVPLKTKNIRASKSSGSASIHIEYTESVDLIVYTYVVQVNHDAKGLRI